MTIISGLPDDTVQACQRDRSKYNPTYSSYMAAAYYVNGHGAPHYPLPAIVCKVVFFPQGSPFVDWPGTPYINWLRYNGRQGRYAPGYETVERLYIF